MSDNNKKSKSFSKRKTIRKNAISKHSLNILSHIKEESMETNLKSIVHIFSKSNRNDIDLNLISSFLAKVKGFIELVGQYHDIPSEILKMISSAMNHSHIKENKVLYRVGK